MSLNENSNSRVFNPEQLEAIRKAMVRGLGRPPHPQEEELVMEWAMRAMINTVILHQVQTGLAAICVREGRLSFNDNKLGDITDGLMLSGDHPSTGMN